MNEQFAKLEVRGRELFLNGTKLKGVEKFEVRISSTIPEGKAELEMKVIVEFPDNKKEQNLLLTEKE
mgnify:CR=1 FL=1